MRVLTVGSFYPPHDLGGGYELVWRSAVDALRDRGHVVRVLASEHRSAGGGADGRDVHRELRSYWADHAFPHRSVAEALAMERHNLATLRRHLAAFGPDVIAWWSMGGLSLSLLAAGRAARVPAVAFVHDDWLDYGQRADGWQRRFAGLPTLARVAERLTGVPTRLAFAELAHYAFVSATTRDRAWLRGVPTPARSVLPSGIDARDPAGERAWDWALLYVGRIDRRKGIETAVDALSRLPPEATLTVAGGGSEADTAGVLARARACGVSERVRLLGQVDRAELPALYAAADAVLFPVEWQEPWGLVPLEAMASGRPVVATGRGGSSEYLEDGRNALLFEAGDAAALADRVALLAADPQLRETLRAHGLETAAAHTEAAFNAGVEAALVAAALTERPGPAPRAPSVAVVDHANWRSADAEVLLFLRAGMTASAALVAAHAEAHRLRPGEEHAVQGSVVAPRDSFARWLAGRGHPPLGPPAAGEIGPARLDTRNASFKRSLLERTEGPGTGCLADLELAYRLSDAGLRLHFAPGARAHATRGPSLQDVRARMPAAARAERALVARHRHLEPALHARLAHAAERGPARGRLGRPLVAYVPERTPLLGRPVWDNASHYYEQQLAPAYLAGWD
ncbi:MAG: glycosyltransferase family 4 protein [Solirubrobacteraceae bacterium]